MYTDVQIHTKNVYTTSVYSFSVCIKNNVA